MGRDKWILFMQVSSDTQPQTRRSHHERLEIRPPPLSQTISNLPVVIHTMSRVELARFRGRGQAFIQPPLQTVDFVFTRFEIVPRPVVFCHERQTTTLRSSWVLQLEKRVRDLQHKDMGMAVIVHYEDAFNGPPHSKIFIVILQTLETS